MRFRVMVLKATGVPSKISGWVSKEGHIKFRMCLLPVFRAACGRLPKSRGIGISKERVGCSQGAAGFRRRFSQLAEALVREMFVVRVCRE